MTRGNPVVCKLTDCKLTRQQIIQLPISVLILAGAINCQRAAVLG